MRRFIIAGCQRSGTTLMRLVLDSHRDLECLDEPLAYEVLSRPAETLATNARLVGFKIPIWSEQLLDRQLNWNEFSDYHKGPLENFYRGEPIVFMIRRPLDTVLSMSRFEDMHGSWLRHSAAPVAQTFCDRLYFRETLRSDIETVLSAQDRDIALAALYWKIKSMAALKYLDAKLPIRLVFYEELVADPALVLRGVLEHLQVEWDENVLAHHLRDHSQIVSGRAVGNTDPGRRIDTHSVGLATAHLSDSQVEVVERIAGSLARTLYALSPEKRSISYST